MAFGASTAQGSHFWSSSNGAREGGWVGLGALWLGEKLMSAGPVAQVLVQAASILSLRSAEREGERESEKEEGASAGFFHQTYFLLHLSRAKANAIISHLQYDGRAAHW